jgi:small-conductance mechanosensitive channel
MTRRVAALLIVPIIVFGLLSPVLLTGDDAVTEDDYYISIPGTEAPEKSIFATVGNGESGTWTLYVVNISDSYLNVSFDSKVSSDDARVTELPGATLLGPKDDDNVPHVAEGNVRIEIDKLSDSHSMLEVTILITLTDVADKTSSVENSVTFNIKVVSQYDAAGMYNKFFGFIPNTLSAPLDSPWVPAIVSIIVTTLVVYLILIFAIPFIANKVSKKTTPEEKKAFGKQMLILVTPLTLLLAANQAMLILDVDSSYISTIAFISKILAIILITIILWRIYMFVVESTLRNIQKATQNPTIDTSLVPLFRMIGRIIFWVGGTSAILGAFGVNLQAILVSAGVISLGITLGAQNVLSQFFSGLVILTTRPFRAGDYLKINDKVYIVRRVNLMYTEFSNWAEDEIITMPNNVVSSATISNTSKGDKACKQYVFFTVAYGTDLTEASKVIIDAANKCDLVVIDEKHEAPTTRVTNFLSSGIEIRLSVYVPSFDDTGSVAGKLRQLVYEAFQENGIEIPYDRVQIDILSDRTVKDGEEE